ncbi:lysozyme inhibitor LprI family protein [Rhizobium sp. BK251]|uniref:lysozyme inhibitor LprI family protein n=1 Tax=Rhizobium sp. BK251 TaxID=2512125 RepID=UPI0010E4A43D|nr:lysozyme inhibitor LprI family protein [Rhizobium sp. BK251]TCL74492.1 uncharacterized protein YecT (DUF1311 family) [Rhizobium sp. BK251]
MIMHRNFLPAGVLLAVMMAGGSALAQESANNCGDQNAQADMNICAQKDYEAADKELNEQYRQTKARMVEWDKDLSENLKGAEKALLAAQRAWIAYRDAECAAEGFQARGGSLEPFLVSSCLATLTRARTKELKDLAQGLGN